MRGNGFSADVAKTRWPTLALAAATVGLFAACGGDEAPGPVDSFCTMGDVTCIGNALVTCADAGRAWKVAQCGASKACSGAQCKPIICEKSSLSCSSDGAKVLQCPADGLADPSPKNTCAGSETCIAGTCVAKSCSDGAKVCGWKKVLTCEGGIWKGSSCPIDTYCDGATHTCLARSCEPTTTVCDGSAAYGQCSATGSGRTKKSCAAGEVCDDGVCHPKVKEGSAGSVADTSAGADGGSGQDTAASDIGSGFIDIPKKDIQLEQPDLFDMIVSETPDPPADADALSFDITNATYNSIDKMLQLTGDAGLNKIEIQIAPIEEFQTGTFTAVGLEAEKTLVMMNDGTTDPTEVQWKFVSADYTITIDSFDDVGGRVTGSFSAELANQVEAGKMIYLTKGVFDLKRGG